MSFYLRQIFTIFHLILSYEDLSLNISRLSYVFWGPHIFPYYCFKIFVEELYNMLPPPFGLMACRKKRSSPRVSLWIRTSLECSRPWHSRPVLLLRILPAGLQMFIYHPVFSSLRPLWILPLPPLYGFFFALVYYSLMFYLFVYFLMRHPKSTLPFLFPYSLPPYTYLGKVRILSLIQH